MLQATTKELLKKSKNLLAFSAGGDSTALLFLLLENKIPFDIAIVDYKVRDQSKDEVAYAQKLAQLYNFACYVKTAQKIEKNFEAKAREIRYAFFEELIEEEGYENLLTAHHLGDRFEWFLMQFCKGAGCAELSGMKSIEKRKSFTLVRPLLHLEKEELLNYLEDKNIEYFEDESNNDEAYTRNYFRHSFSQPLLKKYLGGIKRSFDYIDQDVATLIKEVQLHSINQLAYFKGSDKRTNLVHIDKYLKEQGHLMGANEKKDLIENGNAVIGRKYIVTQEGQYVFIAPYLEAKDMDKKLKEKFRLLKVPVKLRGYLLTDEDALALVSLLLQ